MINSIGLVVNPTKERALPLAQRLSQYALKRGVRVGVEGLPDPPEGTQVLNLPALVEQSDVILVLGGDGSLLRVARHAAPYGKPIMGIQFGRYGFIMETEPDVALQELESLLSGEFTLSRRLMLHMELIREGRCIGNHLALNDVVVAGGPLSRLLHLRVSVGAHEVVRYAADGIIIATPTGSTAYSLSAGGPVVHPDVDVIILTPIAPHTLNSRTLVIPASERIEIHAQDEPLESMVTVDGQHLERFSEGDTVRIERAPFVAALVQTRGSLFYKQLESRLGFGERFEP